MTVDQQVTQGSGKMTDGRRQIYVEIILVLESHKNKTNTTKH